MTTTIAATVTTIAVTAIFAALFFMQERRFALVQAEWATERGNLIQRIQSPEQAVVTHAVSGELAYSVPFDDDEEAAEAVKARSGRPD